MSREPGGLNSPGPPQLRLAGPDTGSSCRGQLLALRVCLPRLPAKAPTQDPACPKGVQLASGSKVPDTPSWRVTGSSQLVLWPCLPGSEPRQIPAVLTTASCDQDQLAGGQRRSAGVSPRPGMVGARAVTLRPARGLRGRGKFCTPSPGLGFQHGAFIMGFQKETNRGKGKQKTIETKGKRLAAAFESFRGILLFHECYRYRSLLQANILNEARVERSWC